MDIKVLLQALGRVWLIEPEAAHQYAEVLIGILNGNATVSAGLFNEDVHGYRVNANANVSDNGEVQIVPIHGVMMKNDYCGSIGTATMSKLIVQANQDPSIKSIVLSIDSPGGSVDGTEQLANSIIQSKKPIVVHAEMMGSAAYMAGSGAKEIVINGLTSMVGSIGTMATIRDVRGLQEKNGIKELKIFASRSIHKNRSTMEALDGNPDAYVKEFLDPINDVFENMVASGRNGKIDLEKEDVMTGKIYLGKQAVKVGLADKMGSFDYAVKRSLQMAQTIRA